MVFNLFYTVTVITVMTNYKKQTMQLVNTAIGVLNKCNFWGRYINCIKMWGVCERFKEC